MSVGTHPLPPEYIRGCTDGFFYCFGKWAYGVTGGFWWSAVLAGFCIAIYAATARYGTPRAFGFAGITGLFGALFMATMQLIPWSFASGFILVGVLGVVIMLVSDR